MCPSEAGEVVVFHRFCPTWVLSHRLSVVKVKANLLQAKQGARGHQTSISDHIQAADFSYYDKELLIHANKGNSAPPSEDGLRYA